MIFNLIIFLFIFCLIVFFISNKIIIDFKSLFRKGLNAYKGKYGVYCYCGKQGRGKTFSVVKFLLNNKDKDIYSNITSVKGVDYKVINNFNELLELRDKSNCIIVYDEIFTALTKSSKINTDVLDFLSQMRKRKIIFITTAQEWLEIPMTLRRYCRYQIECDNITIGQKLPSILIERFYDAEQMKWSNLDNEYVAPLISTKIAKMNKYVGESYDTFEQIKNK